MLLLILHFLDFESENLYDFSYLRVAPVPVLLFLVFAFISLSFILFVMFLWWYQRYICFF